MEIKTHNFNWEIVCSKRDKEGFGDSKISTCNRAFLGKWCWEVWGGN